MIQVTIGKFAVVQKIPFSCIHLATLCAQVTSVTSEAEWKRIVESMKTSLLTAT